MIDFPENIYEKIKQVQMDDVLEFYKDTLHTSPLVDGCFRDTFRHIGDRTIDPPYSDIMTKFKHVFGNWWERTKEEANERLVESLAPYSESVIQRICNKGTVSELIEYIDNDGFPQIDHVINYLAEKYSHLIRNPSILDLIKPSDKPIMWQFVVNCLRSHNDDAISIADEMLDGKNLDTDDKLEYIQRASVVAGNIKVYENIAWNIGLLSIKRWFVGDLSSFWLVLYHPEMLTARWIHSIGNDDYAHFYTTPSDYSVEVFGQPRTSHNYL